MVQRAVAIIAAVAIATGCTAMSQGAQRQVERATLVTKPARAFTPVDIGIPFTRVWIELEGRRLEAWIVYSVDSLRANAAVFICHGTGETRSDWVHAQRLLRESDSDRAFPLSMATELAEASRQPGSLLVQRGFPHNALYARVTDAQWEPLIVFIRTGETVLRSRD